jgi:hypothetical protein
MLSLYRINIAEFSNDIVSSLGINVDPGIVEGAIAFLVFMLFWLLYPKIFRSVVGKGIVAEGSGRSVVVLGVAVVLLYVLSYYLEYLSPDNMLELEGLDQHVSSVAIQFYSYIYSFLEIFPMLLGFAP